MRVHAKYVAVLATLLMATGQTSFSYAESTTVSFTLTDADKTPVKDAVIQLFSGAQPSNDRGKNSELSQKDKQFTPFVLPVQRGTSIVFPNYDDIQHHVYSFSGIKKFELKLSKNTKTNPITFDKPGVVPVGCNIHDWMLAYIYVVDTPYFTTTDVNGSASLTLPSTGTYNIQVWHPRLPDDKQNYLAGGMSSLPIKGASTHTLQLTQIIGSANDTDEDIDEFEEY